MHPVSPSSVSQADTLGTSPFHDQDTLKEVYASPDAHYLGTPINREPPPTSYYRSEDFPEVKPSEDLEVSHKPAKFADGGYYASRGGESEGKIVVGRDEAPLPPTPTKDWKKSWNVRILLVIGAILIILAVILGAVLGSRAANGGSNGKGAGADGAATTSSAALATASSMTVTTIQTGSVTTTASVSPATKTLESVAIPEASAFDIGRSYNASFTRYGTNDGTGGSNCNVALNGCGFYSKPGYAAGVSQNLYGTGPGKGKGPACGTCWFLETFRDASGNELKNNITVIVNDLCPATTGGVCRQTSLTDLNSWDTQVDFNLCTDSGASDAMFGANSGIGLAVGRATRVDCKSWSGQIQS